VRKIFAESLTELISRLTQDRQRLSLIGENAKNLFNKDFSGEIVYGDLVQTLEEIVNQ
jgi:UDP-N-acetylglucosamine:LPS N-acetylglucosamine transferase